MQLYFQIICLCFFFKVISHIQKRNFSHEEQLLGNGLEVTAVIQSD